MLAPGAREMHATLIPDVAHCGRSQTWGAYSICERIRSSELEFKLSMQAATGELTRGLKESSETQAEVSPQLCSLY